MESMISNNEEKNPLPNQYKKQMNTDAHPELKSADIFLEREIRS